jgi:hypothetical protein
MILTTVGGGALIKGGTKVLSPLVQKYGPAAVQRARDLAIRATTKPNPAATPRVGDAPGQIRQGVVQPTQGVRIPKGQPGAGRMQVGPPGRVVDPLRIGVGASLGAKAVGSFMDEEFPVAPTDVTVPTRAEAFRQTPLGNVMEVQNMMEDMYGPAPKQQRAPKKGIAGLLDQAKPYASTAASIAQILGRGAGASKGFEGAKFVEESARLRAAEQARQDRKEALEAELGVRREQIAATQAAAQAAAAARLNQEQMDQLTRFLTGEQYSTAALQKAKELGVDVSDPRVTQALEPLVRNFINLLKQSVGGMGGLESMSGLPEGVTVTRVN